ncbi:MAG: hypothetical protein ICV63_01355 [Coleofasciculus sp. Co-bin14]|nr:hypothetical protein [Coleofasciculus sp. Co-bin14]
MNTQNNNFNQENHLHQQKDSDNRKIWEMEEDIEILREQVDSLEQMLHHENQRTDYYIQELGYTNQELEGMNEELNNLIISKTLPLDEALELAKNIVEKNQSVGESLTELLKAIYQYPDQYSVKVNEFEQIDSSSVKSGFNKVVAQRHEITSHSYKIRADSSQIMTESYKITSQSREIRIRCREITAHSRELRNQLGKVATSDEALQRPALYPTGTARRRTQVS